MAKPWNPFDRPQPLATCLLHEAVLVQAWKKSHDYIRTRNWYADMLELDLSAANLRANIEQWRSDYSERGFAALKPDAMRLVPAPKTCAWELQQDPTGKIRWQPKKKQDNGKPPVMRPLAHLTIRDQTLATAAMICLADVVESAQGDCSVSETRQARVQGVSSYGNRLYCEWAGHSRSGKAAHAHFGWGNADSYRKYYSDYQAFLQRPMDVCLERETIRESDEELAVVSLDLAGFYDRIQPRGVIKKLRTLCKQAGVHGDTTFWKFLRHIFSWRWAEDSIPVEKLLRDEVRPTGLPQGLVASGFFSNAYMIDFDAAVRDAIQKNVYPPDIEILDYCRYVDDMRLTLQWKRGATMKAADVKTRCTEWIDGILQTHAPGQECNPQKTKFAAYRDLRSESNRATTMQLIQHNLSGPMDMETMHETALALDALLHSAETNPDTQPEQGLGEISALFRPFETSFEIRDDTVKRFSAYRLFKLRREQRLRVSDDATTEGRMERHRVDLDIEATTWRMVRLWVEDPSLGIVLRHAMNLMPTPDVLNSVLTEVIRPCIASVRRSQNDVIARWICLYAAADLLKAAVIETGIRDPSEPLPERSDLPGYHEVLADFAEWLLDNRKVPSIPWYVKQQAIMFLVSVRRRVPPASRWKERGLQDYVHLMQVSQGQMDKINMPAEHITSLILVSGRLQHDSHSAVSRLARLLDGLDPKEAARLAEQVYLADSAIFEQLLDRTEHKPLHSRWRDRVDRNYAHVLRSKAVRVCSLPRRRLSLTTVAAAVDNPFRQENAALRLLKTLIDLLDARNTDSGIEHLSPHSIRLTCRDWSRLCNPLFSHTDIALKATLATSGSQDPRYRLPDWCPPDRRPFMILGRLLRAAVTGDADYTAPSHCFVRPQRGYQGIRSSWFKRQYGMFHRPDALGGCQASCSPWISELLAKLLLWPGCREVNRMIPEWSRVRSLSDLMDIVNERLQHQASIYGKASELPMYIHPVQFRLKSPPQLTMVVIQTVRPRREDFTHHGEQLGGPGFRHIRRGHLASLLQVAEKLLKLRGTYDKKADVDLIVLPELSVHEADLDLIERVADRTHAMVFCGLVFRVPPGGPGLVNTARWTIPDNHHSDGPERSLLRIDQGKYHLTEEEKKLGIQSWRPHQVIIELRDGLSREPYRLSGSICFDATDLKLAADLKNVTDMLIIPANNKDVCTFDTMADTLSYHMYQHIVVVNTGEFGGTAVMAPYSERYERVLTHNHGNDHATVSIVDIDLSDYQNTGRKMTRPMKTPPAGYCRHG